MTEHLKLPHFDISLSGMNGRLAEPIQITKFSGAIDDLRAKTQSGSVGFYDWPCQASETIEATKKIAEDLRTRFEAAIVIGIGGSYLGPAALLKALRPIEDEEKFPILWMSNFDTPTVERAVALTKKKRCATVVVSKSGGTAETLSNLMCLFDHIDEKGIVVITDPETGELRRLSKERNWPALEVPQNIGGRFSVLSSVGLLPAALGGLDVGGLIDGAKVLHERFSASSPEGHEALALASRFYTLDKAGYGLHYLMPYRSDLDLLSDWFVQLWGESLGKSTSVGPTPGRALGSSDQHSLLQLFREGPRNKIIGFVDCHEDPKKENKTPQPAWLSDKFSYLAGKPLSAFNRCASLSTEKSLSDSGVPTYRIEMHTVSATSLGAFFYFWETVCALSGELYGINAFDQPGVEEAKILCREALAEN